MNAAAEALTGWSLEAARGKNFGEVASLADGYGREVPEPVELLAGGELVEEFGWTLQPSPADAWSTVDLSIGPAQRRSRRAAPAMWSPFATPRSGCAPRPSEECINQGHSFNAAPMGMVQLDGTAAWCASTRRSCAIPEWPPSGLVGRSLTGLFMDPDPRIAKD